VTRILLPSLAEAYPKELSNALAKMGDYVYGYYRPNEFRPFYVGKGRKNRVLDHWKQAVRSPDKLHEQEVSSILEIGELPVIKLLAYNLENTKSEEVSSTVERALQDGFGIQQVWEKRNGKDRLREHKVDLLQKREDSARCPVLSLEAVLAKSDLRGEFTLKEIAHMVDAPVLMVGLSKTYHPSYGSTQVSEMARMYWDLKKYKNTALPDYQASSSPVLLAWSSLLDKKPMIVGAWRVQKDSLEIDEDSGRYLMKVADHEDLILRKRCLGLRLTGTGNSWQGPRFEFP